MARVAIITWTDDVDPEKAASETVPFAIDGVNYEVDLSADNAAKLRDAMGPWVKAARRKPSRGRKNRKPASSQEMRRWAEENGHTVSARGRIAAPVVEAFNRAKAIAAHSA
ncbi:histone-like nucleoid-structuring protein Lsr2 [Nocardia niigatensis]